MQSERALLVAAGGGIGDTLLAGVVARALLERYGAVDAVVLPEHVPLAQRIPALGRVIALGAPLPARYAAAVVTWATLRTAFVPYRAGVPIRVGQARRLYSGLFTRRIVVRSELGDRTTHWTEILLDYARALDCDLADPIPEFAPRDEDVVEAEMLLRVHGAGGGFVLLHPTRGLSANHVRWPVDGFVALARRLVARDGLPVLITGAPQDAPIAEAIAEGAGRGAIPIAGATSIGTFGALAARAHALIAMDSGPMHVAAAVGAPTVGIFALQSDEPDRWAPRGRRTATVRATYPCPPGHRKETCPDFACVRALDPDAVLAVLDGLLAHGPRRELVEGSP
jgi:ADP-heptose:LPS heptosyltransferase